MNIISLIYDTLEKENQKPLKDRTAHYPSEASIKLPSGKVVGKQLIDQWLAWRNIAPSNKTSPQGHMRFKLGDATHLVLNKILSINGIKVLHEVGARFVHPRLSYPISYRVDSLIETPEGLVVFEIKSTQQNQIYGPHGVIKNGPKLEHVLQVLCYLEMVPGAKFAVLLYIDRGSGGMFQFRIEKNSYIKEGLSFDSIVDRWVELERLLGEALSPAPEHKIWLNGRGEPMPVKTIKGIEYKSDWEAMYSKYLDYIYKNPLNRQYTYNYEFEQKGLL